MPAPPALGRLEPLGGTPAVFRRMDVPAASRRCLPRGDRPRLPARPRSGTAPPLLRKVARRAASSVACSSICSTRAPSRTSRSANRRCAWRKALADSSTARARSGDATPGSSSASSLAIFSRSGIELGGPVPPPGDGIRTRAMVAALTRTPSRRPSAVLMHRSAGQRSPPGQVRNGMFMTTPGRSAASRPSAIAASTSCAERSTGAPSASAQVTIKRVRSGL